MLQPKGGGAFNTEADAAHAYKKARDADTNATPCKDEGHTKTIYKGVTKLPSAAPRFVATYKGVILPGTFGTAADAARAYKAACDADTKATPCNDAEWAKIEADAVADDKAVQLMIH